MDTARRYGNIFRLDGTNQLQRMPVPLDSAYIQPDERTLADLIRYGKVLAEQLRYFNLSGQAVGDWRAFFSALQDSGSGEILSNAKLNQLIASKNDWPPHVALFLIFLKLYQILQADINELPLRHLRHYYENELGLLRGEAQPDSVHVIFELAKNAAATLVKAGTELDAGKDVNGNPLIYTTSSDIVVNASSVVSTYRLIRDQDKRGNPRFFVADAIGEVEGDSWATFGEPQLGVSTASRFMREAELGFALASPVLRLAEGRREIHIELFLQQANNEFPASHQLAFALKAELTGEEGWLAPDQFTARLINDGANPVRLDISLVVEESSPAIIAADSAVHIGAPQSQSPLMRFLVKGESGHYSVLKGLQVKQAMIDVTVSGVKNLMVQNEQGQLQAEKPMAIFGSQPHVGSVFYVGSAEIFSKRLNSFALVAEWQDQPVDLYQHYREYFGFTNTTLEDEFPEEFTADLDLLYQRRWVQLLNDQLLFNFATPEQSLFDVNLTDQSFVDALFGENNYVARPELETVGPFAANTKFGFARLVLTGPSYPVGGTFTPDIGFEAFGHKAFAPRYSQQAIELSRSTTAPIVLPKDPYTPTFASLSVDYSASSEFLIGNVLAEDEFFVIDAFGYYSADLNVPAALVPTIDDQAALFIGIDKQSSPATVSLLFQLDKGTATGAEPLEPGETDWRYLAGKTWRSIASANILTDTTSGWQKPGLISLAVGADASVTHQRMPTDLLWLQAAISKPADGACRLFAVHDRAALAQLKITDTDLAQYEQHLSVPLAPSTITKLKKRNAAIKKVLQPYGSFSGQPREADLHFFQSSSERLRHRRRAVTLWDMEHLVLNEFPNVFKVKCLPHSDALGKQKAGELALVIIPNLRAVATTNPLEPRADTVLMRDIENFVRDISCPFATIHIIHPIYERILIDAAISFVQGFDAGYFSSVLNEDLRRFLSPWAFEEGQDIVFGTRIYRSEVLAFIEGREYVDYVADFNLYHSYLGLGRDGIGDMEIDLDFIVHPTPIPTIPDMKIGDDFIVGWGVDVAGTTESHAILVSHPSHRIVLADSAIHKCSGVSQLGIGYMAVELDFEVSS
jgi:hypothetical protein